MESVRKIFTDLNIYYYIEPLIIITAGIFTGILVQKYVIGKLAAISKRTKWKGDDVIVASLGRAPLLWFVLAGIYLSVSKLIPQGEYQGIARQILQILIIMSVAIVISKSVSGFVKIYTKKRGGEEKTLSLILNIIKIVIYILAALIILQGMGISITPMLTALGVGGLAVALALQDTLSNLFAGVHMIASKKIDPGDYVKLDSGEEGFITDITWRNTSIRTLGNNLIILSNSRISSATLTNFSRPTHEMSVLMDLSVSYGSDLKKVEEVTIDVAKKILGKVEGGVKEFEPFIRYNAFGESGIGFTVILRGREHASQYLLKHEFIKALHARYKEEGIIIPFPQMDVHMHTANK